MNTLQDILDLLRTGLPPMPYTMEQWNEHKCNRAAAMLQQVIDGECCEWEEYPLDKGHWFTTCEKVIHLEYGGAPGDVQFEHCPYCGRRIVTSCPPTVNKENLIDTTGAE